MDDDVRTLLERIEYQVRMAKDGQFGELRPRTQYHDPHVGPDEMAIGDFIVRGRFKTLNQMLGKEPY